MTTYSLIQEFFTLKRFALIGVSRNPKHISQTLFKEFTSRGYDVVPVNPLMSSVEDKRCYHGVKEIVPPVTAALITAPVAETESLVRECAEAGITFVWLYGVSGKKDVNNAAVQYCTEKGMKVIPGYCPFMFLPSSAFFHRLHGSVWKFLGKYPK